MVEGGMANQTEGGGHEIHKGFPALGLTSRQKVQAKGVHAAQGRALIMHLSLPVGVGEAFLQHIVGQQLFQPIPQGGKPSGQGVEGGLVAWAVGQGGQCLPAVFPGAYAMAGVVVGQGALDGKQSIRREHGGVSGGTAGFSLQIGGNAVDAMGQREAAVGDGIQAIAADGFPLRRMGNGAGVAEQGIGQEELLATEGGVILH